MQSKRKRILTMLENGTITTDEALTLLENLSSSQTTTTKSEVQEPVMENAQSTKEEPNDNTESFEQKSEQSSSTQNGDQSSSTQKGEQSMDDFLEDLRKDFTNVGDRFMQFMQTAVQKVKGFDFDSPFGQSVTFTHSTTKPMKKVDELLIDIDNGKIAIHCVNEKDARAEFTVKSFNSESTEKAKEDFLEKMLFTTDDNKLRVSSTMKMTQVNLDLYLPQKKFTKLSARLMNGSFSMKDADVDSVRVKTANGKVEVSKLQFKNAEFETANGSIQLNEINGEKLTSETLNGRIYVDGDLKEVEAQSLSGSVVVTTTKQDAQKINAKTMSGSVEIYIPSSIALSGEIASNIGRLNLQLDDVNRTAEQDQLLQRTIRFKKDVDDSKTPLTIFGEAKTGSVLVCYNASK